MKHHCPPEHATQTTTLSGQEWLDLTYEATSVVRERKIYHYDLNKAGMFYCSNICLTKIVQVFDGRFKWHFGYTALGRFKGIDLI